MTRHRSDSSNRTKGPLGLEPVFRNEHAVHALRDMEVGKPEQRPQKPHNVEWNALWEIFCVDDSSQRRKCEVGAENSLECDKVALVAGDAKSFCHYELNQ